MTRIPKTWALLSAVLLAFSSPALAGGKAKVWTPNGQSKFASSKSGKPSASKDEIPVDVVIIGGGMAGLTAYKELKAQGVGAVVLEASDRKGGRMYTDPNSHEDFGGAWNHGAKGNRMTAVLDDYKAERVPTHLSDYLFIYDEKLGHSRPATDEELAAFHDAEERIENGLKRAVKNGHDGPAADFIDLRTKWSKLYAAEAGQLDNGAELNHSSARDTVEFGTDDSDEFVKGGYGHFIEHVYGKDVPVELETPVKKVDYSGSEVLVETADGQRYRAKKVISTVSNGVLASSLRGGRKSGPDMSIGFSPALPAWKKQAIKGAPMGHFDKIVLTFDSDEFMKYGEEKIRDNSWLVNENGGEEHMAFVAKPFGLNQIVAFVGGQQAKKVEARDDAANGELAVKNLERLFGPEVRQHLVGDPIVTRWGKNPFSLGSYSYSRPRDTTGAFKEGEVVSPGEQAAGHRLTYRQLMFEPVAGADGKNKIHFAGEATGKNAQLAARYNGSVAGAQYSGQDAARAVAAELKEEAAK